MTAFINRADAAMYLSKQNGRNRVSVLLADTVCTPATDPAR
jgi:PleD family two-component response regulator